MIEIVNETKYRSTPNLNSANDSVRVTLDMPLKEWWPMKRKLRIDQEGVTEQDIAETMPPSITEA